MTGLRSVHHNYSLCGAQWRCGGTNRRLGWARQAKRAIMDESACEPEAKTKNESTHLWKLHDSEWLKRTFVNPTPAKTENGNRTGESGINHWPTGPRLLWHHDCSGKANGCTCTPHHQRRLYSALCEINLARLARRCQNTKTEEPIMTMRIVTFVGPVEVCRSTAKAGSYEPSWHKERKRALVGSKLVKRGKRLNKTENETTGMWNEFPTAQSNREVTSPIQSLHSSQTSCQSRCIGVGTLHC